MNRYKPSQPPITRTYAALIFLGVTAATGWGLWLFADRASDQREAGLRQQIATLAQSQAQLLAERSHVQMELTTLQGQVVLLREQANKLEPGLKNVEKQPPSASATDVADTGSIASPPGKLHDRDIASAQKLLTRLGYGPVGALGAVSSTTRQAIELFQYKNGLPVTRDLDTATLEKLFSGSTMTAAQ